MNLSGRFNISPVEKKRYLADFTLDLQSGETITGTSVTISSTTDPTNLGGAAANGVAIVPTGNQFTFFMSFATPAAADLQTYNVRFIATTSLTQSIECVIQFVVKDKVDP